MKKHLSLLLAAALFGFGFGLFTACGVDLDVPIADVYPCDSDDDCISRFECFQGYCHPVGTTGDGPGDSGDGDIDPEECNPEELGEDYPLDPPLDIQEVCDGQDNNCDGNVDIIFCGGTSDCPSNATDGAGNSVQYVCNEGRCEARAFNAFECPGEIPCVGGALEVWDAECH